MLIVLNHFVNFFILPLGVALIFCGLTQVLFRQRSNKPQFRKRVLRAFALATAVLLLCFLAYQAEGRMSSYLLMLLAISTLEFYQLKLWR